MQTSQEALSTLDDLRRIRRQTLEPYRVLWYPIVLFGALSLGSAPLYIVAPFTTGLYWVAGVVAAWIAIGRYYRRRGIRAGVGRPRRQRRSNVFTFGLWLAIVVVSSAGATLHGSSGAIAGMGVVLGAAYLWIAWTARNGVVAATGTTIAGVAIAVAATGVSHPYTIFMLALGALLCLTGFYLHAQEEA